MLPKSGLCVSRPEGFLCSPSPEVVPDPTSYRNCKFRLRLARHLLELKTTKLRLQKKKRATRPSLHGTDRRRVLRHISRGSTALSSREARSIEDGQCTAGMRNPREVVLKWPRLNTALAPVRRALSSLWLGSVSCSNLVKAFGLHATVAPPSRESIKLMRAAVCDAIGIDDSEGKLHHQASSLRPRICFERLWDYIFISC